MAAVDGELVGRTVELAALESAVADAAAGRGRVAVVAGEAGIGKTHLLDELAARATADGLLVLRASVDAGAPRSAHALFRSVVEDYAAAMGLDAVRRDLGRHATSLARLAPVLDPRPQTSLLDPEDERLGLLDALATLLRTASRRAPLLVVLDDVHWASVDALSLLRRVARQSQESPFAVVLAYRDEGGGAANIAAALADLSGREHAIRVRLEGLSRDELGALVPSDPDVLDLLEEKTDGNPFLARQLAAHLLETGQVRRSDGRLTLARAGSPGVPSAVSDVVRQRVDGLSDDARKLLVGASAFAAPFPFPVVADVVGLAESTGLDALDEAVAAGLVRYQSGVDHYSFTHALARDAIYETMTQTRRVQLHRRLADAMAMSDGRLLDPIAPAAVAEQFARSAPQGGAEAGVDWALLAADDSERAAAYAEAADHVAVALAVLPATDERRPALLARSARNVAYGGDPVRAVAAVVEAVAAARAAGDRHDALRLVDHVVTALVVRGHEQQAWELAPLGLELAGDQRTVEWAKLTLVDHRRQVAHDGNAWAHVPDADWDDLKRLLLPLPTHERLIFLPKWNNRAEILAAEGDLSSPRLYTAGDLRSTLPRAEAGLAEARQLGGPARILGWTSTLARIHIARGHIEQAAQLLDGVDSLVAAMTTPNPFVTIWLAARDELRLARDEGWETALRDLDGLGSPELVTNAYASAPIAATMARIAARTGDHAGALALLATVIDPIESLPGWYVNYPRLTVDAAEVVWHTRDITHAATIERNLREKVVEPDFRFPSFDARHALARLAATAGRVEDARSWFTAARIALAEEEAETLLAIVDFDEASVLAEAGDSSQALLLADDASKRFRALGMPGWLRRANALRHRL